MLPNYDRFHRCELASMSTNEIELGVIQHAHNKYGACTLVEVVDACQRGELSVRLASKIMDCDMDDIEDIMFGITE